MVDLRHLTTPNHSDREVHRPEIVCRPVPTQDIIMRCLKDTTTSPLRLPHLRKTLICHHRTLICPHHPHIKSMARLHSSRKQNMARLDTDRVDQGQAVDRTASGRNKVRVEVTQQMAMTATQTEAAAAMAVVVVEDSEEFSKPSGKLASAKVYSHSVNLTIFFFQSNSKKSHRSEERSDKLGSRCQN